jgi:hypothetical protein
VPARDVDATQQGILVDALKARKQGRGNERWWIGMDDRADEGHFKWLTGASTYLNWDRGEPDNAGCNQDCVAIDADDGRWSDSHCNDHKPFVCRAPD